MAAKKLVVGGKKCDHRGWKPALILEVLRGAEAPLFHGANMRSWVFPQRLKAVPFPEPHRAKRVS
jgi:hypothetical protein